MKPSFPLFLAALLAAPAQAGWRDISSADFTLEAPPAPGTDAYKADFDELLKLQKERGEAQCKLATSQRSPDLVSFYAGSGLLSEKELAKATPLFAQILQKVTQISNPFKAKFKRPRPYDADERIKPCAPKPGGATSYPSTHSMAGAVYGCALAKAFPDRAEKLAERGNLAGDLRKIAGVHHPSDVAASQALGAEICAKLLADKGFVKEIEAASR